MRKKLRHKKSNRIVSLLILLLIFLGIGYAYLTTTLSINGTSDILSASWDIHFENIIVKGGSVAATNAAVINAEGNTVTYTITLTKPGDFYEFTVDAVNDGTIDGMIESVNSKLNGVAITNLPAYLEYQATYYDGEPIQNNHLLAATKKETYKIHIGYKADINANELPSTNQSYTLSFTVTYKQADSNAYEREKRTVFSVSSSYFKIGEPVPNNANIYYNMNEAMSDFEYPFFLEHHINNNIITESLLALEVNNTLYYLYGGSASYYEQNKAVIKRALGDSSCNDFTNSYWCSYQNTSILVSKSGEVTITDDTTQMVCTINYNGQSNCQTFEPS